MRKSCFCIIIWQVFVCKCQSSLLSGLNAYILFDIDYRMFDTSLLRKISFLRAIREPTWKKQMCLEKNAINPFLSCVTHFFIFVNKMRNEIGQANFKP